MSFDTIKMAMGALLSNKVRTLLSMLGIIIGVCTVIVVFAIGQGAQKDVADQYKNLSVNSIMIMGNMQRGAGSSSKISADDVEAILEKCQYIDEATAVAQSNGTVSYVQESSSGSIMGSDSSFFAISNLEAQYGRVLTDEDNLQSSSVVVLGSTVAETLFGEASDAALGETVTIDSKKLEVVGILTENGSSGSTMNYDESVFAPYSYAKKKLFSDKSNVVIMALANDVDNVDAAIEEVTAVLRTEHKLKSSAADDFRIMDAGSMVGAAQSSASTLTMLLTLVATVVLLVSGIGIMNVMFVTVAERTKEIGIAKAIGGTQSEILGQFLSESVILSMIGGLLGVGTGQAAISMIENMNLISVTPTVMGVAIGFGFSVFVGVFFGFYPALKASKLDPVDALRSE
ncbi:MAG: ABC transporter permease [Candidatus Paceibacterota bacterium]